MFVSIEIVGTRPCHKNAFRSEQTEWRRLNGSDKAAIAAAEAIIAKTRGTSDEPVRRINCHIYKTGEMITRVCTVVPIGSGRLARIGTALRVRSWRTGRI
ncbi:hypothetical protein [Rhizomicrobium electricum]|uniref:Uncharacterized protein n=1 Tax=Rhizomicrobium electricum TaxID=480070 RepID=A0ABN1EPC1_9PROT|nr:hypothetical protein [Rhizomicrobium electricum]NIJ48816.1 hypothetical protein [Rhizomicrobium electricum]